ncbi:hypothetical protein Bca52824_026438 [Brassica carinata]|uniref:Uncharacterized protein n=1 Tax=Brassica carinata TaxID=52824 RepID=A0A8X7V7X3_BRACI|nr:hypothetical protein Bca52824_026438 [Brassica carinata]
MKRARSGGASGAVEPTGIRVSLTRRAVLRSLNTPQEEVASKTRSFDNMKSEAKTCSLKFQQWLNYLPCTKMAEEQIYQEMYQQIGEGLNEATDSLIFQGVINEGHVQLLHAAGISSYSLLRAHLGENDGVDGLASATLNIIVEEIDRIRALRTAEKNLQTTASNIGKRDQRHSLNRNKKRIEELTIALALRPDTAANVGQRAHWKMEKEACETRVANMEQNN